MVALDFPAFNLVYAFLVLVPGFLSFRVARHHGKLPPTFTEFDKVAYGLMGSGVSLFVLAVGVTVPSFVVGAVLRPEGAPVEQLLYLYTAIDSGPETVRNAKTLLSLLVLYPLLLGVSYGVGRAAGSWSRRKDEDRGITRSERSAWDEMWRQAAKKYRQVLDEDGEWKGVQTHVRTDEGRELFGRVEHYGYGEERDLFLRKPWVITRQDDGTIATRYRMKDGCYIPSDNVDEIFFVTELPPFIDAD